MLLQQLVKERNRSSAGAGREIIKIIEADEQLQVLWRAYQKKYSYAAEIDYASVISGVRKLMDWIR